MRSPNARQASGTTGRLPLAMTIRLARYSRPPAATVSGPNNRARHARLRSPSPSVALSVPATNASRRVRTRRNTAGTSIASPLPPRMPKASKV